MVERHLAKVEGAGSTPVSRSDRAGVAKLADAGDLKSPERKLVRVQIPPSAEAGWSN
ncbi:conserved protein of unknown function [Candidatus Bipolaricaulis anaerobius]|uniref:Uncharacterized protein n=1 Tax=Candidatus Bipolaricaulis anaerobius TaxID=2026885 RepID=A0A2X3KJ94_9BACT|nr:conserved protein of unknown function [Candidatus Bipolaricaulis anaerobius]